jgi:hypothetical protein
MLSAIWWIMVASWFEKVATIRGGEIHCSINGPPSLAIARFPTTREENLS